jgi:hypothetical protein
VHVAKHPFCFLSENAGSRIRIPHAIESFCQESLRASMADMLSGQALDHASRDFAAFLRLSCADKGAGTQQATFKSDLAYYRVSGNGLQSFSRFIKLARSHQLSTLIEGLLVFFRRIRQECDTEN